MKLTILGIWRRVRSSTIMTSCVPKRLRMAKPALVTPPPWRLLAERGTRGLDVVHALGPIRFDHFGLGIAERLAQCAEHRLRMFFLELGLDHRDALLAI